MTFEPSRDADGVRQALLELMEEGFAYSRVADRLEGADAETIRRALALPDRSITPGYYRLGEYLLWLSERIEARVPVMMLAPTEVDGLVALARARVEFNQKHPACPACGAPQETRFVTACHACGTEFKRR